MSTYSSFSHTHRIIITYLCIVLGFLLLGFVVWTYFEYKTNELRLRSGYDTTAAIAAPADLMTTYHTKTAVSPVFMRLPVSEMAKPQGKDPARAGRSTARGGKDPARAGSSIASMGNTAARAGKDPATKGMILAIAGGCAARTGRQAAVEGTRFAIEGTCTAARISTHLAFRTLFRTCGTES